MTSTDGNTYNSKLGPNQTQQIIQFAVRKPVGNADSIVDEDLEIETSRAQNVLLTGESHRDEVT
ncbi:hypothetical protein QBC43DRAFT_294242 [Cladorrhinum sp. PSN259]|nr:hypothetical protein QBC43DRAFT_294242 [Cladorrhinum sp. PSN259]